MYVLGIETSCDETGLAVLHFDPSGKVEILSDLISSQVDLHAKYGGVVPELASREHLRYLPLLLDQVMKESELSLDDLDLIGVTRGPGLKGCLLVGHTFAKGLGYGADIPVLGVNHIEGHILSPFIDHPELTFPYLALVVSGGHTEIVEVSGLGKYKILSRTIDDAAGEAFDKSANLLGIEYPGGAKLAKLADDVEQSRFTLPKVMQSSADFSFSGLKTAILLLIRAQEEEVEEPRILGELCYAVQDAIVSALLEKLRLAIKNTGIKKVAVVGGVSANKRLRETINALESDGVEGFIPSIHHCTDNGAMIGLTAGMRYREGESIGTGDDFVLSRWPVEESLLSEMRSS